MSDDRLAQMRALAQRYPREFHDYRFLLDAMDRRVTELLEANNRLVSERNVAIGRALHFEMSIDFLLRHNGMAQMRRLEAENRVLKHERDEARHQQREAGAQAQMYMDKLNAASDHLSEERSEPKNDWIGS